MGHILDFSDQISVHFSGKSPRFVPFEANLTIFGAKPDINAVTHIGQVVILAQVGLKLQEVG